MSTRGQEFIGEKRPEPEDRGPPQAAGSPAFRTYLREALALTLRDEGSGADNGNLAWMHRLCRRGVQANWQCLTPEQFLEQYFWCVGSIQKDYAAHEKYFPDQMALFRQCGPASIAGEADAIRAEWAAAKCYLNGRMVEAVIETATRIAAGWDAFRAEHLPAPDDPEAQTADAWWGTYNALDRLPMVGDAIAWYLIRNLFGAPFFKPDLHINAIVTHFFGAGGLDGMTETVRRLWPQVCDDPRLLPVHLGEVDYVLWWYRQATGLPPCPA